MELFFSGTREILKGIWQIFDAFRYLLGLPIKNKKRREIKFPRFVSTRESMQETKKALGDDRRRLRRQPGGKYFF